MRRADRLFQIIQILRRRKVITASHLAMELEVSPRTIYHDIADLIGSGVPIEGEAGTGYILRKGFDLPPLMFTPDEIEVLALGVRVAANWVDSSLKNAAADALAKIQQVLPENRKEQISRSTLFSPPVNGISGDTAIVFRNLRDAINMKRKVSLQYTDSTAASTVRVFRPLCMAFFAPLWIISGWCELRDAFRNFRLDRITGLSLLDETFTDEPGHTLNDLLAVVVPQQHGKEHSR